MFRKWHDEPEIGRVFPSGIQVWKQKRDVHEVEWFSKALQQSQDGRSANGHAHPCRNPEPCQPKTRGRLRRPHVIGGERHRIGKEVDRRWEEGDDLDAMHQTPIEYTRRASRAPRESLMQPSLSLSQLVKKVGIRKLIRQGLGRRIIEKISRRELVKASTYRTTNDASKNILGDDRERSALCN